MINSILFSGVYVAPGAVVKDSVVFSDSKIMEGAVVSYSMLDHDVVVGKNAVVGKDRAEGVKIAVVGAEIEIGDGKTVEDGAMIYPGAENN